jgi:amino acid transporter
VHRGRHTPWLAIVFTTALAAILVVSGDLTDLADTTVVLLLLVFAAVNVCVLVLRRDRVDHDHFRAPSVIPVVGAAVSLALLTTKDGGIFVRAGLLLVLGVVLWGLTWLAHGRHARPMDTGVIKAIERPGDGR